jgi:MHS family proline/betaine transporter-like MFS transporter
MASTMLKKAFWGAAIGTLVEYYDYTVFSIFLPIISPFFFPAASAYESLVKGYYIFSIAMFARPLGGLFFGYLGDNIGRPKALLTSMYGIALSTVVIGLTPPYAVFGIWAIVLITAAKAVQIACFGGEYNGATIYVVEHAQNKNELLISSLLTATMLVGSLVASFLGVVLTFSFMPSWSWRIAFILGGCIGLFGIIYRKNLVESPHFTAANRQQDGLMALIKKFPRELLAGIFIGGLATVPFGTIFLFIMPVLMSKGFFNNHEFMLIQSLLIVFAVLTLVIVGIAADKQLPGNVMRCSCWLLIIFSYPLLSVVDTGKLLWIIPAAVGIIAMNEMFLGPSNAYLKNIFPMHYRYRGSSLSFCIGLSLFGGLTPIVENKLYQLSGKLSTASLWLILVTLGALFSLEWVKARRFTADMALEAI